MRRHDAAGGQFDLASAATRDVRVVRDHHERRTALPVQLEHQVDHRFASARIEAAGRFVGEQQGRLQDEGACQRDPLLFAAAEILRIVREPFAESHPLQQLTCCLDRVPALRHAPAELERQQHVLQRRQVRQQLERLEHESESLRAQRRASVLVERKQVVAEEADRASRGNVEPREQSQQGRLARARSADDRNRLAGAMTRLISSRIVRLPVASCTTLLRPRASTATC